MARLAETLNALAPIGDLARIALRSVGQSGDDVDPSKVLTGIDKCGEDASAACRRVFEWTGNQALADITQFLVDNVLRIVVILVVALVVSWLAGKVIHRSMSRVGKGAVAVRQQAVRDDPTATRELQLQELRVHQRTETIASVLTSVTRVAVWTLALILVLGELGLNLGPLIAGAGIVGVALGFGAQSLVKDFLSGIFMVMEDQFGVGDVIDVGEAAGEVERVTLRTTVLRDVYGTVWYVPNGEILRVGNKSQFWARAIMDVGIAHGTDIDRAQEILASTAAALAEEPAWRSELLGPPEVLGVQAVTVQSILIRVSVKTRPAAQFAVERELNRRFRLALDQAGIASPTLTQPTLAAGLVEPDEAGGTTGPGDRDSGV